ncbi:MAG: uncharacterized protein KVP18_003829 [Porospora cf. gigantea A]|uniref:uncharacterized protein n=1 Tax=Porospora cf. gigantea A TaxID=2853593 RepID=UPI00355A4A6F|nr:MAG: hypothetical protein KVP18_003829 [Porospora cf. gigantea A]
MYDNENIFARILRKDIPAYTIFETDDALAILDAFPAVRGHSLLIPKSRKSSLGEMTAEEAARALQELPRLIKLVKKATGAPSVNVLSNNGSEAGQMVFHTHIHVIPRFPDDRLLKHPASKGKLDPAEAAAVLGLMMH